MRLTINMDEQLYAVAKSLARAEDLSISAAVNKLLQRAIEREPVRPRRSRRGFPVVRGNKPFGPEDVARLEDPS